MTDDIKYRFSHSHDRLAKHEHTLPPRYHDPEVGHGHELIIGSAMPLDVMEALGFPNKTEFALTEFESVRKIDNAIAAEWQRESKNES